MTAGALGELHRVELPAGTIEYHDFGTGRPVVFLHGLFVNGDIWRNTAPAVAAAGARCIVPHWPFGSHTVPMSADARLDPPAVADLIADFLAALDLSDVVLVANDTGGAFAQVLITRRPERIGALVLTPSDSYERFFPPLFRFLQLGSRVPGFPYVLAQSLRIRQLHRLPIVFGLLSKRPLSRAATDSYLQPMRRDALIRRDLGKLLRGVDNRHTLAAAEKFGGFTRPVLLAWAPEDKLFPLSLARRHLAAFPDARLERIEDSFTFVPEDQPERLAELLGAFAVPAGEPPE